MKRRTFVNGVISAGVFSTATTIPALSDANDRAISKTFTLWWAQADTSKDSRGRLNPV